METGQRGANRTGPNFSVGKSVRITVMRWIPTRGSIPQSGILVGLALVVQYFIMETCRANAFHFLLTLELSNYVGLAETPRMSSFKLEVACFPRNP